VAAKQDSDGGFETGSRIHAISVHAHLRNRQITGKMYTDRVFIPLL